jgi:hypothetical protein
MKGVRREGEEPRKDRLDDDIRVLLTMFPLVTIESVDRAWSLSHASAFSKLGRGQAV